MKRLAGRGGVERYAQTTQRATFPAGDAARNERQPHLPKYLNEEELADWRAGRNAISGPELTYGEVMSAASLVTAASAAGNTTAVAERVPNHLKFFVLAASASVVYHISRVWVA